MIHSMSYENFDRIFRSIIGLGFLIAGIMHDTWVFYLLSAVSFVSALSGGCLWSWILPNASCKIHPAKDHTIETVAPKLKEKNIYK